MICQLESTSNKTNSFTATSTTTYPNTKALVDGLAKVTGNRVCWTNTGDENTTNTIEKTVKDYRKRNFRG
jgi:hypothetical protein